jgi:hypothetical protein
MTEHEATEILGAFFPDGPPVCRRNTMSRSGHTKYAVHQALVMSDAASLPAAETTVESAGFTLPPSHVNDGYTSAAAYAVISMSIRPIK